MDETNSGGPPGPRITFEIADGEVACEVDWPDGPVDAEELALAAALIMKGRLLPGFLGAVDRRDPAAGRAVARHLRRDFPPQGTPVVRADEVFGGDREDFS